MNYRSRIVVGVGGKQLQANWNETDPTSPQFIQNKPDISGALTRQVVQELPTQDIDPNCIYMIPVEDPEQGNYYEEWMYIDNNWEQIGSTAVEQVQSDWNEDDTTSPAYINNKPTIPTVNNATLTIQTNGQTAGTFTANADTNTTIDIEVPEYTSDLINDTDVYLTEEEYEALEAAGQLDEDVNYHIQGNIPTKTSDLTNDSGFITAEQVPPANDGELDIKVNGQSQGTFTANQSGDTSVDIPMATPQQNVILGRQTQDWYGTQAEFDTLQQAGQLSPFVNYYIENALAQVATSGSYNDLSNQPTIPDEISDLTDDVNVYLTQAEFDTLEQQGQLEEDKVYHIETEFADVAVTGSYNDLTDKPTIPTCNNKYDLSTKSQAELANFYQNYQTIMDTNTLFWGDSPVVSVGSVVDPGTALTVILVEYNPFALSSTVLGGTYHTLDAGVKVILPDGSIQDSSATMKLADANRLATVATSGSYADLSNTPANLVTGYNNTAYTLRYISESDYNNLGTYDNATVYLIY